MLPDIACFINIFSTDPITKTVFKRVAGTSSAWLWYLWAHRIHPGSKKVLPNSFLCFSFNLNFQYIEPQPSFQILIIQFLNLVLFATVLWFSGKFQ